MQKFPGKYDWEKWFNGEVHEAKQGIDFHISLETFRIMVHTRARARDGSVETSVSKKLGVVRFQYTPPATENEPATEIENEEPTTDNEQESFDLSLFNR